ncbi:uncharacterized protein LOC125842980 [Solanum stenotomum]|uniref:uncharacterized protein LOC125842980 n=1 Tax=Solanum stenotomum TaxID=172797 RepID=UPI0020D16384|nr:uncharacterized protein LOC125842980 [Solanum stenotomum]
MPPSLVSNPRDEMSRFVMGVYDSIEEECRAAMLHDNMDISRLLVYAQQVEETRLRKKNREVKRASTGDVNSSKGKFEVQGLIVQKCSKKHEGKCLVGTDGCFNCGKSGHMKRDCPMLNFQVRKGKQVPPSGMLPRRTVFMLSNHEVTKRAPQML